MSQYMPVKDQCPKRCQQFFYFKKGQLPGLGLAESIAVSLFSPDFLDALQCWHVLRMSKEGDNFSNVFVP